jgi:N-acetylglucosamine kinase-like BadF-type ATPase
LVFELAAANDSAAMAIVDDAADALAELVGSVSGALGLRGPVVLAGGLLVHQPVLSAGVRDRLAGAGLGDVRVLAQDPAHGALALARSLLPAPVSSLSWSGFDPG